MLNPETQSNFALLKNILTARLHELDNNIRLCTSRIKLARSSIGGGYYAGAKDGNWKKVITRAVARKELLWYEREMIINQLTLLSKTRRLVAKRPDMFLATSTIAVISED